MEGARIRSRFKTCHRRPVRRSTRAPPGAALRSILRGLRLPPRMSKPRSPPPSRPIQFPPKPARALRSPPATLSPRRAAPAPPQSPLAPTAAGSASSHLGRGLPPQAPPKPPIPIPWHPCSLECISRKIRFVGGLENVGGLQIGEGHNRRAGCRFDGKCAGL